MRHALLRALVAVLAASAVACGGGAAPTAVLEVVPEVLLDRGVLWRPSAAGAERLLALADLDPGGATATVLSAPPAAVIVAHDGTARAVRALVDAGYASAGPDETGWTVLTRVARTEASLGFPVVGVRDGLLVAGDAAEVEAVRQRATDPDPGGPVLPVDLLEGASAALLGTPAATSGIRPPGRAGPASVSATAGALPAYGVFAVTGTAQQQGAIALVVPGATQDDAVALSVRASSVVVGEGLALTSLLRPGAPLTAGDRVVLPVEWRTDPVEVLTRGLESGFGAALAPSS